MLGFDPRGVNGSIPQASCYISATQRAEQTRSHQPADLVFEAGEIFTNAENRAKACADTMGEYGPYINTPQTAADMNSILDAIGQEEMYYWGGSCKFSVVSLNAVANMIKTVQFWDRHMQKCSQSVSPG